MGPVVVKYPVLEIRGGSRLADEGKTGGYRG
jgi:hypothetical protein